METYTPRPIEPGQPAPDFDLPLVDADERVTLAEFRGVKPLLLGLFRGLACPFCRRLIATTNQMAPALDAAGVAILAVTATPLEAARLYARYRPSGLPLASDPWFGIHKSYGVPMCEITNDKDSQWPVRINMADTEKVRINPYGELPEPLPPLEAGKIMNKVDDFDEIETDEERAPSGTLALSGFFLIDIDGIVRWRFVEAVDSLSDYGVHPNEADILQAAHSLAA